MLFKDEPVVQFVQSIGARRAIDETPCFQYSSVTTNLLSAALAATFDTREVSILVAGFVHTQCGDGLIRSFGLF